MFSLAVNNDSGLGNFDMQDQDIPYVDKRQTRRQKCVPSTNQRYGAYGSENEDRSPLLDVSNDIEQCSDDWPIDPDNQSEIYSNMTEKRLHFLGSGNARIKNLLMELFLLVNMAQLMYVAALSFYKILIVSEGISIAEICLYRFGILLAFESLKWACCGPCFPDGSSN